MSRWYDFYKGRMNDRYREHVGRRYAPLIEMVTGLGQGAGMIAEMGCGAANVSRHIASQLRTKHLLTDNCEMMRQLAMENMVGHEAIFVSHDLLSDDYSVVAASRPKIIHGHGVLEHFQDDEIRHIVARQLECAKFVLHYVPTSKYKTPSFGDERLMTPMEWDRIARPFYRQTFNDGYDLLLGWRRE